MNNIRDIRQSNIKDIEKESVHRNKNKRHQKLQPGCGFTDDALEELIASVEAEGMLHPPKGFHDDIISRIRRKRKYKKNLQLFSYSMKVITATAAAVGIVLIVPDNISTQESRISGFVSERQEGGISEFASELQEGGISGFASELQEGGISGFVSELQESGKADVQKRSQNEKLLEREKEKQEKIQEEIQKKSQNEELRREKEMNQYAQETEKLRNGNFIHRINRQMDEYVNIINGKLNQFVRMEVDINEKEEK